MNRFAKKENSKFQKRFPWLYLPPYSPDFNPIEMAFSKLKARLRKNAPRTINDLWDNIGRMINAFSKDECINYFAAAGYKLD